jgi:hypothetical protein
MRIQMKCFDSGPKSIVLLCRHYHHYRSKESGKCVDELSELSVSCARIHDDCDDQNDDHDEGDERENDKKGLVARFEFNLQSGHG